MKPTAVIDKCVLQPICAIDDDRRSEHCLRFLADNFTIYAPVMLIEEIAANYYRPTEDISKESAVTMLQAVSQFRWMEHPLELVYQELVLKKGVRNEFELNPSMARIYSSWVSKPDAHDPELEEWFNQRYEKKQQNLEKRQAFQKRLRISDPTNPDCLSFSDLPAFVQTARQCVRLLFADRTWNAAFFSDYLGAILNGLHPEMTAKIKDALKELSFDQLLNRPFTHDYIHAYFMYLYAPVARIGPKKSQKSNPCILPGEQNNNEADEEYVTSALLCDYLLTCDKGMHTIAEIHKTASLFRHKGQRQRTSVLIPRQIANQVDRHLAYLVSA